MTSSKRKQQTRIGLILGAMIMAYICYALIPEKFQVLDSKIIDRLLVLRSQAKPIHQRIEDRIVHIDANFYFSRSQHARILRNLSAMGVTAQLIDFQFVEMVSQEEDQPLIQATRETGNVYYGITFESLNNQSVKKEDLAEAKDSPKSTTINWPVVVDNNPDSLLSGTDPQFTYPALSSAAQGLGFLNLTADPDGILRRLPLLVRYQGAYIPGISLRVMVDYLGIAVENIIVKPGKSIRLKGARKGDHFADGDIVIPIDEHGRVVLDSTDLVDGLHHYSYSEIFQASEDSAKFEKLKTELTGKIAVISETVENKYQIRDITNEKVLPSGVIQAMVLQNLLSGSYLRILSDYFQVGIEIVLLVGIFFLSLRFSSTTLSLAASTLAGLYIALAVTTFVYAGIILQFTRPILLLFSTLIFLLIGLGIERAVLFARSERARNIAERDLEIGREIQAGFFPTMLPQTDGWELAAHFQAARHVAGDFYDIFTLGQDKKVAIVIADVCDKGVGAALFMALFRSFIRVLSGSANSNGHLDIAGSDTEPEKILQHAIGSINNYISITHEQAGMFATIFYGILDPQRAELTYINGGHEPPIIKGPQGIKAYLAPSGPAVGLYPDLDFKVRSITLEPDDMLLVYTDGATDARNRAGDAFTKKQLLKIVGNSSRTAEDLIYKIKSRIDEHIHGADQFDDITMVALRRK
jgi:sigma-B regulation protein RsbU (phosphoserine phosphatase)